MMNADSASSAPPAIPPTKDDMGVLMYTSGTTGNPKGVMLSHENICSNTRALLDFGSPEAADAIGGTLSRGDDVSLGELMKPVTEGVEPFICQVILTSVVF